MFFQDCQTTYEEQCDQPQYGGGAVVPQYGGGPIRVKRQSRNCRIVPEQNCETVNEQQCETTYEEECTTTTEQQCAVVHEEQVNIDLIIAILLQYCCNYCNNIAIVRRMYHNYRTTMFCGAWGTSKYWSNNCNIIAILLQLLQ